MHFLANPEGGVQKLVIDVDPGGEHGGHELGVVDLVVMIGIDGLEHKMYIYIYIHMYIVYTMMYFHRPP